LRTKIIVLFVFLVISWQTPNQIVSEIVFVVLFVFYNYSSLGWGPSRIGSACGGSATA
jgi:hypothetical protein